MVDDTDVLIVGAGPAGAATAIGLARGGHRVTVLEKRAKGRHKSCGDVLTPRSVNEFARLGIDVGSEQSLAPHRLDGVVIRRRSHAVNVPWPEHAELPDCGYAVRRSELDAHVRSVAADAGATILMGHEATTPVIDRGFVRGADVNVVDTQGNVTAERRITARFVVVADGANSAFGRSLGTTRERRWPYGIAARTYFDSPRSAEHHMETTLALAGPDGQPIAGYGWVVPLGDGTINVGVGISSASRDVIGINALRLLRGFTEDIADRWGTDPDRQLKDPTRLRLPLGGSVGPTMGPTFLVVGDAGGLANPLDGDGVDAALVSARHAVEAIDAALTGGSATALQQYATSLQTELGEYHHVARLATRLLGRPAILRPLAGLASRNEAAAGAMVRIANRMLRTDAGAAERLYRTAAIGARLAPSW